MKKISAVINTLNEANNIRSCLQTLSWCDEVVIVDMFSEDDTVKIASEFTSKIILYERQGYVEPARKFAVENATGDWILIVDADELLPVTLSKRLVEYSISGKGDVVYIPRKNYIMGEWIRHTGWWPDFQPRFFRKGSVNFTDQIHAGYQIRHDAIIEFLPDASESAIEHFAYDDAEHFIKKLNTYTNYEAKHLSNTEQPFDSKQMLLKSAREFYNRFIKSKGYKDGYRGFFLSLMMAFYQILVWIKLWELSQNEEESTEKMYKHIKNRIVDNYSKIEK